MPVRTPSDPKTCSDLRESTHAGPGEGRLNNRYPPPQERAPRAFANAPLVWGRYLPCHPSGGAERVGLIASLVRVPKNGPRPRSAILRARFRLCLAPRSFDVDRSPTSCAFDVSVRRFARRCV